MLKPETKLMLLQEAAPKELEEEIAGLRTRYDEILQIEDMIR